MKLLLYLDTAICLYSYNPENDLKECLARQMTSASESLPIDCISIVSGLQNAVSATMQRKNYREAVVLIPEETVLELEINLPLLSFQEIVKKIDGGMIRFGHHRSLGYGLCHISEPKKFERDFVRYTISADIVDGILVHGGIYTDDFANNKKVNRGNNARDALGRYILPATTIKGTFRSHCKRLVEYFHIAEYGIDAIFGNPSANIDACVVFYDAIITEAKEKDIFRCHVDKLTGGVFGDGTGFMRDIFITGKIQMVWDFMPQQCGIDETDVHRLLLFMIQDIQQKRVSFGRGRGTGKGFLDVNCAMIKLPHGENEEGILLDYKNNEITDPTEWITRQCEKKDGKPPVSYDDFQPIENKFELYKYGFVKEADMFYGREKDIDNIIRQISNESGNVLRGRCLALYGQAKSGKTSLLYHLEQRMRAINPEKNVIVNIGSIGGQDLSNDNITGLLYTLLDGLQEEISYKHPLLREMLAGANIAIDADKVLKSPETAQLYFNSVFQNITGCIEESNQNYNIVVMIDEFTYIYDWIRKGMMTDRIMKFWKAFIQNYGIFAIIVGLDHMMQFVNEKQFTDDFGSTDLRKVTYLPEDDAKRLMYEPIMLVNEKGEKTSRYREGALERIYELTAGSAYLIMYLCAGLVDYMNATRSVYITQAHIDDYLKKNLSSFDESFFEPQYYDRSYVDSRAAIEENKRILRRIAKFSDKKEWAPLSSVVQTDTDKKLIDALEQRDVVELGERGTIKIKVALYKEWILARELEGQHE